MFCLFVLIFVCCFVVKKASDGIVIFNGYCDFCLGGFKKTGCFEDFIFCVDCGRLGDVFVGVFRGSGWRGF